MAGKILAGYLPVSFLMVVVGFLAISENIINSFIKEGPVIEEKLSGFIHTINEPECSGRCQAALSSFIAAGSSINRFPFPAQL